MLNIPEQVAERAATRYIESATGCWISTYSTSTHGYAQIGWSAKGVRHGTTAHRAAWVHQNKRQPEGTIDHLDHCDRRCVRPDHLRDISNYENARRNRPDAASDLLTCLNGHASLPVEKRRNGKPWFTCPDCHRERMARYNAKPTTKAKKNEWARARRSKK